MTSFTVSGPGPGTATSTGYSAGQWREQALVEAAGPDALVVVAYGDPAPQGSKTRGRNGGVYESSAKTLKPWREAVKWAVIEAVDRARWSTVAKPGGVDLDITVTRERLASHFGTGRNAGIVKPWAVDALPTTQPDGDKLERAIWDALKWGGVYEDDSQVTDWSGRKRFAHPGAGWTMGRPDPRILTRPGAAIIVRRLP